MLIYTAPIFHDSVFVLCSERFSRYEGYTFDLLSVWNKDVLIYTAPIFHDCVFVLRSEEFSRYEGYTFDNKSV